MRAAIWVLFLWLMATAHSVPARQAFTFENKVYQPHIGTVQCYNLKKEQWIPLVVLGSDEKLLFSFDDLRGGSRIYWYTIEHCRSDWQSSGLSTTDYMERLPEDRITDYKYSFGTLQKYTSYALAFPNEQVRPKIPGNYLLKVYEQGDQRKPVVSQRFYVLAPSVNISADVVASPQVALRQTNQKLNFTVFHSSPIQNPYADLKVLVMQNGNPLATKLNTRPQFIRQGSLVYTEMTSNDFPGLNEYRKFDIRSLRYKAENVQQIVRDTGVRVRLFADLKTAGDKYSNRIDEDGRFYIRNQDGRDDRTESDYVNVSFTLNAVAPTGDGEAYVIGRFNNYRLDDESRLTYDASSKQFSGTMKLKQGLYDYRYVWADKSTHMTDQAVFEGSFYETGNTYQVFVYYRRPGSRWEELIGFTETDTRER